MSENPEFRRSSTKRRNTEINEFSRRNTYRSDKSSQTDLTVSANLFEELSKIIDPETSTLEMIYSVVIKLLKNCTSSSWVEFALIEDNKLKVCSIIQQNRVLEMDSGQSLMAYVAINQQPVLLTNPHTSSFYLKFPVQLHAYSLLTGASVKPSSIACIPIYDNFSKLYGIVQLFNKLDRNLSQSFFAQEDIYLVQSIGKFLGTILHGRESFFKLESHHNQVLKLIDYNKNMYAVSNNFKRKDKLLDGLSGLASEGQPLNKEVIEITNELMETSAAILLRLTESEVKPMFEVGRAVDWEKLLSEVKICLHTRKAFTNLRDLFHFGLTTQVKSCLIIPLVNNIEQIVLIMFRDSREFEVIDEEYLVKASGILKNFVDPEGSEDQNRPVENLLLFEISDAKSYSLISIFQEFKEKLSSLAEIDSSSVYIVNQKMKTLWTKNTYSSEALIFPIMQDSILGFTYNSRTLVMLPDSERTFSDINHFKEKFIACIPIQEQKLKHPVIGIILISKSSPFTEYELWVISKYSETFSSILYMAFLEIVEKANITHSISLGVEVFSRLKEPNPSHKSKSYNHPSSSLLTLTSGQELFKQINKSPTSKKLQSPHSLHPKLSVIEPILEDILKCDEVKFQSINDMCDLEEVEAAIKASKESNQYVYIPETGAEKGDSLLTFQIDPDVFVYFRNFRELLSPQDIDTIINLSRVVYELKPIQPISEKLLEQARLESLVSRWTSQLICVSNVALHKLFVCKSVIYKLASQCYVTNLVYASLDVIAALTNSSEAMVIIREDISYLKFKDNTISDNIFELDIDFLEDCLKTRCIKRIKAHGIEENAIVVPIVYKESIGVLCLLGKKDETNRDFIPYTNKDEKLLQDLTKSLAQPLAGYPNPPETTLPPLAQYIRSLAIHYSPQTLLASIRKASQVIFNCDKVNVFLTNPKELCLLTQGLEDSISESFSLPLDNSIFVNAVTSGKPEFINDVYNNPLYDPELDKITGYKTVSFLCIPLHDSSGRVFCLIECVNKLSSAFNEQDLESATNITSVFERVLENWELVKKNIEEIFRLKGISNSIASYILVFDQEGKLSYTNKQIEKVFGMSETEVSGRHFSEWLQINKELKEDIEAVYANPSHKIRRTSQKISSGRIKRLSSTSIFAVEDSRVSNIFNYRIVQLQDISSELFSGVVAILEDCSALEALHQEFREVQNQIRAIVSPIAAETGLQKCIRELSYIASQITDEDVKEQITEVIERLKAGGLKTPKFLLSEVDKHEFQTVNSIFYMDPEEPFSAAEIARTLSTPDNNHTEVLPLAVLRDWNLNAFTIENKFDYIYSMLTDFNAIGEHNISIETLFTFTSKIQNECDKRNNPFHNFNHCFSVMHSCYMLLSSTSAGSFFSGLQIFGLLIAALCHDVDHTGRTNMFEVNSKSRLSVVYNDKSVLEQHHAATAFEILMEEDSNIFKHLSRESYRDIRKTMITAIMGTDMVKHYSILTNVNARAKDILNSPIGTLAKDSERLTQFILHAADLAHPTKLYRNYEMWSMLVCQEFSDQHAEEIKKGLPITEFMKDLRNPKVYYANEIGFLNYVVRPLWECANSLLKPHISILVENLDKNIEEMKRKLEEWKRVES